MPRLLRFPLFFPLWADGVNLLPAPDWRFLQRRLPVRWLGGRAIWLRSDQFFYLLDP